MECESKDPGNGEIRNAASSFLKRKLPGEMREAGRLGLTRAATNTVIVGKQ
jgi:hypothetical protein